MFRQTDGFGAQCGDLIGSPLAGTFLGYLGIESALKSSPDLQYITCMTTGGFQSCSAPENTGQVVCPPEGPGHCQHHITDFPPQGGSAVSWFPADRTFQDHIVDWFSVFADYGTGEYEYQQMPFSITADIMGSDLARYGQHSSL